VIWKRGYGVRAAAFLDGKKEASWIEYRESEIDRERRHGKPRFRSCHGFTSENTRTRTHTHLLMKESILSSFLPPIVLVLSKFSTRLPTRTIGRRVPLREADKVVRPPLLNNPLHTTSRGRLMLAGSLSVPSVAPRGNNEEEEEGGEGGARTVAAGGGTCLRPPKGM